MNRVKNARANQRRRQPKRHASSGSDIWRAPTVALPEVDPIVVPGDVGALLRSLGDPPMKDGMVAAGYFTTVIERAAGVALALAFSAELVAPTVDDDL